MSTDTKHLRALLAASTPGPWKVEPGIDGYCVESDTGKHVACYCFAKGGRADADAALIAASVNALPDLLSVVERVAYMDPFSDMECIFCACDEFGPTPQDHGPSCAYVAARALVTG